MYFVCVLSHSATCQAPLSMGILQARILEWVVMPIFRRSSWPRDPTQVSCIAGRYFIISFIRETLSNYTNKGGCLVFLHISLCYLEIKALKIWYDSKVQVVKKHHNMLISQISSPILSSKKPFINGICSYFQQLIKSNLISSHYP